MGEGRESSRPEVAYRLHHGIPSVYARVHALKPEEPWVTACGYTIDSATAHPLGVGELECQSRACQKSIRAALGRRDG